jgi:hypothetical protein
MGTTPPSVELTGVCVPVPAAGELEPAAGVPSPLKGVTIPLGGTGILMSSGLLGTSFCGRSLICIRLALLLYEAGMISMISSRGNCRLGMSVAEQAIR